MRILYFSDNYTFDNYGTKRSIFEEIKSRGIDIIWVDRGKILNIIDLIKKFDPDHIWLAHSNLRIKPKVKKQIKVPVVGFGFSDPYYFSPDRFASYDVYITNHDKTMEKYKPVIPIHYNKTACDFRYHKNLFLEKEIDISLIGCGIHPRFKNGSERIGIAKDIKKNLDFNLQAYGKKWFKADYTHEQITGDEFLNVINRSKIGLDVQDDFSPLAHRMLEYAACGVPVITRDRSEVFKVFEKNKEILTYIDWSDLKEKLNYYLRNPIELNEIGLNAEKRCKKEHNISFRVDEIFNFLKEVIE